MASIQFPTSQDIYLEINGKKLAVVESYRAKTTKESRYVEAFGEGQPVGVVGGRVRHRIELSRVCALSAATGDGVDMYTLSDFNLVIVKPDRRIVYSGCEWYDISESAGLSDTVAEKISIVASKRMELLV